MEVFSIIVFDVISILIACFFSYVFVGYKIRKQIQIQERNDVINSLKEQLWELRETFASLLNFQLRLSCDYEQVEIKGHDPIIAKLQKQLSVGRSKKRAVLNDLQKLTDNNKSILGSDIDKMLDKLIVDINNHEKLLSQGADEEVLVAEAISDIEKIRKKLELLKKG